jgi:hypothetical protein
MKYQTLFKEPKILIGKVKIRNDYENYYLPPETVMSHTLVVSRSGGGKSHALATLAYGLARTCANRKLNLLHASQLKTNQAKSFLPELLIKVLPNHPPLSLCVFDPHRDLARKIFNDLTDLIAKVKAERQRQDHLTDYSNLPNWEDLLSEMITYIDLGNRQQVFGLNLLDVAMWDTKENCASTVIEIMRRIYPDSWGVRMEDVIRHTIYALYLLNTQRQPEEQFSLVDVVPFITIDQWRNTLLIHPVISRDNPAVSSWWQIQFESKMNDNFRNEVIKPVLNKFNPFIGSDILARIFGQAKTTLDFAPLLKRGSLILIDLAASEIETENCALAGAILIGYLLNRAKQIADDILTEADRPQVQLMVDEFNVLLAAPYTDILGQYRKWGVKATLATQSLALIDELDPTLKPLIMANCANLLVLQVNAEDGEYLRRELVADATTSRLSGGGQLQDGNVASGAGAGGISPDLYDLVNAERGMCYFKGTISGMRRPVFTVRIAPSPFPLTLPEKVRKEQCVIQAAIIKRCHKLYTLPANQVSAKINQKIRDYTTIHRLKLPATSSLIMGFVSENDTAEMLDELNNKVRLKQEEILNKNMQEEARRLQNQQIIERSTRQKVPRQAKTATTQSESKTPKAIAPFIPQYAPEHNRATAVRDATSSDQRHKEGLRYVEDKRITPKPTSNRALRRQANKQAKKLEFEVIFENDDGEKTVE